jgi:hypothetical protein
MSHPGKAVVLLSGGLDSATVLAIVVRELGLAAHALSFDYGQRHRHALTCALRQAEILGAAQHRALEIDRSIVAGSALTGGPDVPVGRDLADERIPATYVPARNTLFLAHALAECERIGAERMFPRRARHRLLGPSRLPSGVHRGVRAPGQPGDEGVGRGAPAVPGGRAADRGDQGGHRSPGRMGWAWTWRSPRPAVPLACSGVPAGSATRAGCAPGASTRPASRIPSWPCTAAED